MEDAGVESANVRGVTLCMAGVDRPGDARSIADWLVRLVYFTKSTFETYNDTNKVFAIET